MKQVKQITIVAISTLLLCLGLHSCGIGEGQSRAYTRRTTPSESAEARHQREQERLRNQYSATLLPAAKQISQTLMKRYSPNTGKDARAELDLYNYDIVENKQDGYIACWVSLSWQAKESMFFGSYNECIVEGYIYYYPKLRSIDEAKAIFIAKKRSQHAANVIGSGWQKLSSSGITITVQ